MRSWVATAGIALVCLPCLLVVLVGAGIGTGVLSVIGSAFSEPGLAFVAAFIAVLLFAAAAIVFVRSRADAACETDLPPVAGDDGRRRTHEAAGSRRGDVTTQEDSAQ